MAATPTYGAWHTSATLEDDVRTIFVTGFPPDTKERELQNLLRWWPGYEACQLTMKGDSPIGFALFSSPAMAIAARDALQGLVFDLETNSTLRAEMAKKNLFVKKGVVPPSPQPMPSPSYETNKRMRGAEVPGPMYIQPMGGYMTSSLEPPQGTMYPSYSYGLPTSPIPLPSAHHMTHHHQITSPSTYSTPRRGGPPRDRDHDNPPCNTLFVGGLGDGVLEHELQGIFGALPGYRQMKILRQAHGNVCFIEFADIDSATAAHAATQGVQLQSSESGGLRVQFSKNPFGRKKDGTFHPGAAAAQVMSTAAQEELIPGPPSAAADTE